jgi:hypothetical protein
MTNYDMANYDDLLDNAPAEKSAAPQLSKEEWAAERQAAREELFALSDKAAVEVAADGGRFQQYLDVQGRFSSYTAVNSLLVLMQQDKLPTHMATKLGDFDYWKDRNASVKRKSIITILVSDAYVKDDGTSGVGYNAKKVFDISQVDARRLRIPPPPRPTERQLLSALIAGAPVKVAGVEELPDDLGAIYDPETNIISVRKGMEFPDTFHAIAQEMAYADLTAGEVTQAEPHFGAYCASYLLCKKYGVDTQAFSFENAPGVFEGMESREIKGELSEIRDAAANISWRMSRQIEAQQKAAKSQDAR